MYTIEKHMMGRWWPTAFRFDDIRPAIEAAKNLAAANTHAVRVVTPSGCTVMYPGKS